MLPLTSLVVTKDSPVRKTRLANRIYTNIGCLANPGASQVSFSLSGRKEGRKEGKVIKECEIEMS